jgi:signal transduction histidine kinase
MTKLKDLSIRIKLLGITFIILTCLGIVICAITSSLSALEYPRTLLAKNTAIAHSIHSQVDDLTVLQENDLNLNQQLKDIVDQNSELSQAMVVTKEGLIVAHSNETEIGHKITDKNILESMENRKEDSSKQKDSLGNISDLIVPISNDQQEYLGEVILTYHSNVILNKIWQQFYLTFILTTASALFTSLLLSFILEKLVTIPLDQIISGITNIYNKRDFAQRITQKSNDEIGILTATFNDMAKNLQELYSNLEEKVKEKTVELEKEKDSVEQKVIERTKQLSDEHARLEASINSLSIGYILTDNDNQIILINKKAEDILILSTSTAISVNIVDASNLRGKINMDFIQSSLEDSINIKASLLEAEKYKKTIILKEVKYKTLYINIFITPIKDKNNEVIGKVILLEDITEQKILERSKDEFFSIASHELRTPLTAIRGNASILKDYYKDEIKNPEILEILDDIHDSGSRLIDIVNDFLDMSRLEQGRTEYVNEPFDIIDLSKEIIKEYTVTGSRKKLYLEIDTNNQILPLVYADKNRTRQIMINLIGNGIKFTEKGGVTISFKENENDVKVFVTDTGMGIDEANQSLLFRKFQQAQSNILTRDASHGTGLGLYISKKLATNMGGDISLENSEVGKGSTFCLTLPIATEQQRMKIASNQTKGKEEK